MCEPIRRRPARAVAVYYRDGAAPRVYGPMEDIRVRGAAIVLVSEALTYTIPLDRIEYVEARHTSETE